MHDRISATRLATISTSCQPAGDLRHNRAPPQSPNLAKGIFMRYMAFGECARTSPEQPCSDQNCQYDGGKLGHVAGIGAIQ
jgi:hypothetical protein